MKIIFVDGYNVINSWPNLKSEKKYSFDGARQTLINKMHNYSAYEKCKIIIVFDAQNSKRNIEYKEVANKHISVVFTKDGETADGYIEKEVHNMGRKYEVHVVTSDRLEQETIFQRGAVRVSSLEFYNEVIKTEQNIRTEKMKNGKTSTNLVLDNVDEDVRQALEAIRRSE